MRAIIVDSLLDVIEEFFGPEEGHREDKKFIALANRIQGKEVELLFIAGEAFEINDINYWLPDCCWTEIKK